MMQGKSNKAICRALDVAEPTVKIHVSAILKALKVANRTEAVIAAGALGLESARSDAVDPDGVISPFLLKRRRGGARVLVPQEPVERGPQRHRRHRLLQQVISAYARLAQPLGRGVAAYDESRNRGARRLA